MDDFRIQELIHDLQNGNDRQRRAASYKLGNSKNPVAVPALINAFKDPDGTVQQNVINGLKNIATPEALDFLNSIGKPVYTVTGPAAAAAIDLVKKEHLNGKDKSAILVLLKNEGLTPFDAQKTYESAIGQLESSHEGRNLLAEKYRKQMNRGLLWAVGGTIVTIFSYSSASSSPVGGTYYVFWGAIIFGIIDFIVGYVNLQKYQ